MNGKNKYNEKWVKWNLTHYFCMLLMNNNYSHVLIYLHNEKESKQYGNTIEADS